MNVSGTVEDIVAREVNGYDTPAYDIILNGKKYGHGFSKPSFAVGDEVSFEVDVKKNGKYTNYNIRRETVRAGVQAAARSADTGEGSGYDRNRSIVRQNSLAHATALVTSMGAKDFNKAITAIITAAKRFEAYSMLEEQPFDDTLPE